MFSKKDMNDYISYYSWILLLLIKYANFFQMRWKAPQLITEYSIINIEVMGYEFGAC